MNCPLLRIEIQREHGERSVGIGECVKEKCAWWGAWTTAQSEEQTGCCFPVLITALCELHYTIRKGGKQ